MTTTHLSRKDYFCALAVVVIWGTNFVAMKVGMRGLSPMLLGALRFALAAFPLILFVRAPRLPWRWVAAYGLVQGLGQFGLLFTALKFGMPAGMASLVIQTQAFFTLLLAAPILHERAQRHHWIGLGVAALGLAVIAGGRGEGPGQMTMAGFVLTLGGAFMWAVSNIIVRLASRKSPGYDPFAFIAWSSAAPVLPFLLLAVLIDGWQPVVGMIVNIGWGEILSVLYLAVLATLVAYTLWTQLLTRHAAAKIAPFSLLVPVVGLWAASVAFGERLETLQWVGVACVLAGLLFNQLGGRWLRTR
ncbi:MULTISPECIES: EamA family transporter [Achromobacter]|jgi:O-acetylserine/cysteine efflux transporter|uniref:EamA family transporter n=1 Tax=Achromobacter aegrifaciens TaxID=1287736 RepID=A0AAD2J1H6_ACHAE|nr:MULTISPECIES: EamA family transporter [Achromobacter]MBD9382762.1 EamA family transporter [Achromobacter sp. ACM02]MBD9433654.1 EamA family transporter [Achromobacter sp. ACM03]MBD9471342.1 EamA family transporter [Achromobacter sp. ACM01]MDQ1764322.1 EamA family transporter [Achromobacter aegrifaciens]MDR7946267.1 EamA family transporter [Achromobacter aegrifaciens]